MNTGQPIRSDVLHLWRAKFPTHAEDELLRFMRTVAEALAYREPDWSKLRPDEDLAAIKHRWSGGDGMELVELVMAVECEYSLELPEEFLSTDKTLAELFDQVTRPALDRSTRSGTGLSQSDGNSP